MKRAIYIYFSLVLALFSMGSCSLLDQTSPNDLDASTAIKDAASAEAALLGVYSSMQQSAYYGGSFPLMTEPLCNNAATGGFQVISLDQLSAKEVTPANLIVEEAWIAIYRTIANANALLEALPKVSDLDDTRAGEIEGQARALRAMAHFDLLRMFGEHWDGTSRYGIPVIDFVQTIEVQPTRATVESTYAFIINELKAAADLVNAEDVSRQYVNLNTVNALLARVQLYHKTPAEAAAYATKVIDNATYSLYEPNFYAATFVERRTPEAIFELAFDKQNRSDFNGLTYSRPDALRTELFYMTAADLDAFFQSRPGDVRSALADFSPDNNDPTILPDGRTQKYRGEDSRDNPAYLIRLAEMYLIRAEALGRTDGLADLNLIREKRGLSALTAADVATDDAFLDAVLAERRAEFNFEGHYYFDLARTGRYASATGADDFRAIMPVPNREVIASGGKIEQNRGF